MKRYLLPPLLLLAVLVAVFSFIPVKQAERFYYAFDEKVPLETVEGRYVVRYSTIPDTSAESARLGSLYDTLSLTWKDGRTAIMQLERQTRPAAIEQDVLDIENVYTVQPLYQLESGMEMPVTDELVIGFPNGNTKEVDALHKRFGVTVLETNEIFQLLRVPRGGDALEIANYYQESGFVEFSHPNFLIFAEAFQAIPNDPYFNNQFYLRNTGQVFNPVENHAGTAGADISVLGAWDVTMGDNAIIVAVLDDGVTANHPDLPNARQVRLNGSNFGGGDSDDPSPTGQDNHGNACAGIIAATRNNGQGIAGVAPNVRIMPVRMMEDNAGIGPAGEAAAILFAVNNGAHVLSCSWGYNSDNPNLFPVIVNAIQHAVINGRGGLGTVVVFAAGNWAAHNLNVPGFVSFPSNVNITGVITVGASDRDDLQADYSPTSNPNSPNNQIIDIVAPSHRAYPISIPGETVEIWSIDVPGNDGYNPWSTAPNPPPIGEQLPSAGVNFLSYTGRFGGTSAAAPQIAGIAALMLSINPSLTQQQVFDIITGTADQVGGYNYVNGRSNELGFGRANACAAVISALPISGPSVICAPDTYVLNNVPAGATVTWTAPLGFTPSSGTGATAVITLLDPVPRREATFTFTVTTACGSFDIHKQILVGGDEPQIFDVPSLLCAGATYLAYGTHPTSTYYHWGVVGGTINLGQNSPSMQFTADYLTWPNTSGTVGITLTVHGECGNPLVKGISVPVTECGPGGGGMGWLVYPNPANESLSVGVIVPAEDTRYTTAAPVYKAILYDSQGKQLRQGGSKEGLVQFDTRSLAEGTYFLHIHHDGEVEKRQIVIRH